MTTAVGIDVGKVALDLAVDGVPGVVRFTNNAVGIRKLAARLGRLNELRIVLANTIDPRCTQQPATGPGGDARACDPGTDLDKTPRCPLAVWQATGRHRQQACPTAVGDALQKRGLRCAGMDETSHGSAAGEPLNRDC